MQHAAQAHLHLPDALLSFWRADVLTSHASTSSALFYCFTETWLQREVLLACDTPTASVLHITMRTDASFKLTQFVTILLQHIHCTLVLQLYLELVLQYYGVFIGVFLSGKCSSCTAIWRPAIPVHKLSNSFSFCNGVKSSSYERLCRVKFCKILDLQNKEIPRLWLRTLETFTPMRD